MNPDPTGTDPTGTDGRVTLAEIAEVVRQLRAVSRPGAADPTRDTGAGRAVFLARKADLLARITTGRPDPAQPRTQPDGDRA